MATTDPTASPRSAGTQVELAEVLEQLVSSQRQLRALLDSVPAMIGYWDRDLRNVHGNHAYLAWFGVTPGQMRGKHISEIIGPRLYALNLPHIQAVLAGEEQHFDRTIVDASGEERFSQASYIPDIDDKGVVHGFFVLVADVTARVKAERELAAAREELERRASTDPLTGLANRTLLDSRIELALAGLPRAAPGTRLVALLLLDLDDFKPVNDKYGHAVGDGLLVALARRMQAEVREPDLLARIGGDEFVILASGLDNLEDATALADRIVQTVQQPWSTEDRPDITVQVGGSIGIATAVAGEPQTTARELIRHADQLMYAAKRKGGSRAVSSPLPQ